MQHALITHHKSGTFVGLDIFRTICCPDIPFRTLDLWWQHDYSKCIRRSCSTKWYIDGYTLKQIDPQTGRSALMLSPRSDSQVYRAATLDHRHTVFHRPMSCLLFSSHQMYDQVVQHALHVIRKWQPLSISFLDAPRDQHFFSLWQQQHLFQSESHTESENYGYVYKLSCAPAVRSRVCTE